MTHNELHTRVEFMKLTAGDINVAAQTDDMPEECRESAQWLARSIIDACNTFNTLAVDSTPITVTSILKE